MASTAVRFGATPASDSLAVWIFLSCLRCLPRPSFGEPAISCAADSGLSCSGAGLSSIGSSTSCAAWPVAAVCLPRPLLLICKKPESVESVLQEGHERLWQPGATGELLASGLVSWVWQHSGHGKGGYHARQGTHNLIDSWRPHSPSRRSHIWQCFALGLRSRLCKPQEPSAHKHALAHTSLTPCSCCKGQNTFMRVTAQGDDAQECSSEGQLLMYVSPG